MTFYENYHQCWMRCSSRSSSKSRALSRRCLTLYRGRPQAGFAHVQTSLMSNVRPRKMTPPYCIDPDQFLDMSGAVPVGKEDVRAAWDRAYALAEQRLNELGATSDFYLVFGLQGAGKSTWVAEQSKLRPANATYLSGPLPSRRHRERALAKQNASVAKTSASGLTSHLLSPLSETHVAAAWLE